MSKLDPWGRLAVVLLRLIGRLPLGASRRLFRPLAPVARLCMIRRRRIVRRNLALCFPDMGSDTRDRILKAHFVNLVEMLAEIAWSWAGPDEIPDDMVNIEGLAHLHDARAHGGVLLVTGHSTCLEIGGRLLAERVRLAGIYRPLASPALEAFQNAGRARYTDAMYSKRDVRGPIRRLRAGGVLWYAPDQDFGPERSVFAPFFGLATATLTATLDLARSGRARIVPMYPLKDVATGRVRVVIGPAFADMPSADPAADLGRINAFLEGRIRQAPAQYWWLHRRFKTAPPGAPDRYRDP